MVLRRIDLSKIDPETLRLTGQALIEYRTQENSLLWFRDGFVLNDQPRIFDVVKELMAATLDFAVGRPETGQILREGLTLRQAEQAIKGAKVTLDIDISFDDEAAVAGEDRVAE